MKNHIKCVQINNIYLSIKDSLTKKLFSFIRPEHSFLVQSQLNPDSIVKYLKNESEEYIQKVHDIYLELYRINSEYREIFRRVNTANQKHWKRLFPSIQINDFENINNLRPITYNSFVSFRNDPIIKALQKRLVMQVIL